MRRIVGLRWTQNKSWVGSRMSTQPKKEIWEGSRRIVGSRWTQNKNWEGSRRVVGSRWTQNKSWEGSRMRLQ